MCLRRVHHLLPRPPQVDRKAHLQTVCGLRVVKCPYGCLIRENPATNAGVASDNVNTFGVAGSGSGGKDGGEAAGEAADLSAAQALLAAGANMTMFPAITVVPWTEEDEREAKLRQMAAMEVREYMYMGAGTPLSSHEHPLVLTVFPSPPHRRAARRAPPKLARAGRTRSTRKRRRRRARTAR